MKMESQERRLCYLQPITKEASDKRCFCIDVKSESVIYLTTTKGFGRKSVVDQI